MSGIVSAITRAVWAFILLGLAAVLAVAATDDPLAWRLLSLPGLALIGAASLVLGWLSRARRPRETAPEPQRETRRAARAGRREPAFAGEVRDAPAPPAPAPAPHPVPTAHAGPRRVAPVLSRRTMAAGAAGPGPEEAPEPPDAGTLETSAPGESDAAPAPDADDAAAVPDAPQAVPLRLPPPTGNDWVDACFDVADLGHRPETRRWVEIPALVEARRLRLSEDREAALARLAEIRAAFPDHDGVYLWSAEAHERGGDAAARDAMLEEGLGRARAKDALLATLGTAAAEERRLDAAIRRLIQSAALQLGAEDGAVTSPDAFVELAALAAPHRQLGAARDWLAARADASAQRTPVIGAATRARREALSREEMELWMVEAVETLWQFYR